MTSNIFSFGTIPSSFLAVIAEFWNLTGSTYDSVSYEPDAAVSESSVQKFYIKPDGTTLFHINSPNLYQHSLSTPWDLSTATTDNATLDVSGGAGSPYGLHIKPTDGEKMYLLANFAAVYSYTMGQL